MNYNSNASIDEVKIKYTLTSQKLDYITLKNDARELVSEFKKYLKANGFSKYEVDLICKELTQKVNGC